MPGILNFIPISCIEPRSLPEDTHVIFQPTLVHWSMFLYFKFELCTQRWHALPEPRAFLREAPICKKLIPKFVPIRPIFFTTAWYYHDMTPCQVSWFSGVFWIYKNFKTKFLNLFGRATTPRCLNFIPICCMGPRISSQDTHVIFQPTLVHLSMCL